MSDNEEEEEAFSAVDRSQQQQQQSSIDYDNDIIGPSSSNSNAVSNADFIYTNSYHNSNKMNQGDK